MDYQNWKGNEEEQNVLEEQEPVNLEEPIGFWVVFASNGPQGLGQRHQVLQLGVALPKEPLPLGYRNDFSYLQRVTLLIQLELHQLSLQLASSQQLRLPRRQGRVHSLLSSLFKHCSHLGISCKN